MVRFSPRRWPAVLALSFSVLIASRQNARGESPYESALTQVRSLTPTNLEHASAKRTSELALAAKELDRVTGEAAWKDASFDRVAEFLSVKEVVDALLEQALALRTEFGKLPNDERQKPLIRQYLAQTACLTDLAGRMRYIVRDAVDNAADRLSANNEADNKRLAKLLDLLIEHRVAAAAEVMSFLLFDYESESGEPFPASLKLQTLELIARSGETETLYDVAEFLREPNLPAPLVLAAADAIRRVGLPQDPLPSQDVQTNPPPILARELRKTVAAIPARGLKTDALKKRGELLTWLDERIAKGVVEKGLRVGAFEVQSGDWLLMRNPSPYNTFTDLAPGLFTHVGVVAEMRDAKGIRRLVITDLPERGDRIPAETVDAYLRDTQHFIFLRHADAATAAAMGAAAAAMIGNETQFDLLFDTSRVLALRGKPLDEERIHTYCAGFLLICALQTGRDREEFFPVAETRPGGHCQDNLQKLGLAIGDDFVSPTGAIFSEKLAIVGRREPIYDPARQVKEHVYDSFGRFMVENTLTPSPDLYQSLRQTVADLSKQSSWLARALAKLNNVSPYMDLEAAARAAAVVETLDRIADRARDGFLIARRAMLAGPESGFAEQGIDGEMGEKLLAMRARHRDLYAKWQAKKLTPRELRIALVDYYQTQGRGELEQRFFSAK